jgi:hypothetical protein
MVHSAKIQGSIKALWQLNGWRLVHLEEVRISKRRGVPTPPLVGTGYRAAAIKKGCH